MDMDKAARQIRQYVIRWREQIAYLFFGVLTVIVYNGAFWLLRLRWGNRLVLTANAISFALATAFAYLTNKAFVFRSRDWSGQAILREAGAFLAARLASFSLEEAGLYVCAYVLHLERFVLMGLDGVMISKFGLSALSTVLNYFFSKFWIFSKKQEKIRRVPDHER